MATLTVPPVLTTPADDAMKLYRAFKGFGCDNSTVINILAHRDATQRALIQQEYHKIYSQDMMKRLASELTGKFESAVKLWMHDPAARDAIVVRKAFTTTPVVNLQAVTEVICSRTPTQIQVFKQHYYSMFGVYLEQDIEANTSGDHKKLLLAYVTVPRYEGVEVDRAFVEMDAKALYKAGEKRFGTDEKTFIQIFTERSRAHIAAVDAAYHHMHGKTLKKAVKSETSGYFLLGLVTIVQCSVNSPKYFAKVLYKAMKGLGTDDNTLIRVIVTRAEIDLQYIKAEYVKKYKKTLNDAVHSETSGSYRTFLLELLGRNY